MKQMVEDLGFGAVADHLGVPIGLCDGHLHAEDGSGKQTLVRL